jgi:hypothetical protein
MKGPGTDSSVLCHFPATVVATLWDWAQPSRGSGGDRPFGIKSLLYLEKKRGIYVVGKREMTYLPTR